MNSVGSDLRLHLEAPEPRTLLSTEMSCGSAAPDHEPHQADDILIAAIHCDVAPGLGDSGLIFNRSYEWSPISLERVPQYG